MYLWFTRLCSTFSAVRSRCGRLQRSSVPPTNEAHESLSLRAIFTLNIPSVLLLAALVLLSCILFPVQDKRRSTGFPTSSAPPPPTNNPLCPLHGSPSSLNPSRRRSHPPPQPMEKVEQAQSQSKVSGAPPTSPPARAQGGMERALAEEAAGKRSMPLRREKGQRWRKRGPE